MLIRVGVILVAVSACNSEATPAECAPCPTCGHVSADSEAVLLERVEAIDPHMIASESRAVLLLASAAAAEIVVGLCAGLDHVSVVEWRDTDGYGCYGFIGSGREAVPIRIYTGSRSTTFDGFRVLFVTSGGDQDHAREATAHVRQRIQAALPNGPYLVDLGVHAETNLGHMLRRDGWRPEEITTYEAVLAIDNPPARLAQVVLR